MKKRNITKIINRVLSKGAINSSYTNPKQSINKSWLKDTKIIHVCRPVSCIAQHRNYFLIQRLCDFYLCNNTFRAKYVCSKSGPKFHIKKRFSFSIKKQARAYNNTSQNSLHFPLYLINTTYLALQILHGIMRKIWAFVWYQHFFFDGWNQMWRITTKGTSMSGRLILRYWAK